MAHADDLQAVSVDEALIDVTTSVKRIKTYISQSNSDQEHLTMDPAKAFADAIRSQVRKATNCEGSPKLPIFLAKYASNQNRFLQLALVLRIT